MCFCCSHLSSPSPRSSFGSDRTFIGRQWCARKCKEMFGSVYRPLNEKILSRTFCSNVCCAVQRCFSGRKNINYAGISQPWGLGRLKPPSPPPTDFFIKKWRLTVSEVFSALQLQVTRQPLTRKMFRGREEGLRRKQCILILFNFLLGSFITKLYSRVNIYSLVTQLD